MELRHGCTNVQMFQLEARNCSFRGILKGEDDTLLSPQAKGRVRSDKTMSAAMRVQARGTVSRTDKFMSTFNRLSTPVMVHRASIYLRETGFNRLENSFNGVSGHSGRPHLATGTAGLPWTNVIAGTGLVTTLPAVTTAPSPISTSGRMITPGPMKACFPIRTPRRDSLKCAMTITPIPIKALSSMVIR